MELALLLLLLLAMGLAVGFGFRCGFGGFCFGGTFCGTRFLPHAAFLNLLSEGPPLLFFGMICGVQAHTCESKGFASSTRQAIPNGSTVARGR